MSKKILTSLIGAGALSLALLGCGSAPGSEGVSFVLIGAYQETPVTGCNDPTSLTNISLITASFSEVTEAAGASAGIPVTFIAQNNTSATTIRGISVKLDYYVPGSSVEVPSTVVPFSGVAGPASVTDSGGTSTGFSSTLPGGSSSFCTTIAGRINAITPQIRDFLRFNLTDIEPPIDVIVTATITGVTSAGDRIETNPISFTVNLTTDTVVTSGGAGAGGLTTDGVTTDPTTDTTTPSSTTDTGF